MIKPLSRHRSATLLVAMLGIVPALGAPAFARTPPPGIGDCAAITSNRERLACYDRISASVSVPAPDPESERAAMTALAAPASASDSFDTDASAPSSPIDAAWGFAPDSERYTIAFHRPNYLQFARYSSRPNNAPFQTLFATTQDPDVELDSAEARFQISFKARLWATDNRRFGIWAAYTQQSQWQVYNDEVSRPFRENNYMPELMASFRPDVEFGGFHWRLFNFGYTHQSNGRADPISRSWDRLIAEFGIERGNFALLIRPWYRLAEDEGDDDNPDILDYYGHGDITAIYQWRGHSFSLMGRGNLETDKGAAQFSWTTPPLLGPLRGYVQAFTGYGDSLIDYNWKQNAIGIGVTLNDQL
ncbi:phospholipase [Thiocystis minor]|uniref:phospholipase A n=1 Tax=Thiocystis minor TaxID=61597 RepID=UPI001911E871|nr:phospholipase A [Thiocystis minor]MBK5962892.1 phospholipase [Thiocystis minor]